MSSNKIDRLKEYSSSSLDLFIGQPPQPQQQQQTTTSEEPKDVATVKEDKKTKPQSKSQKKSTKMYSIKLPLDIIEKIDRYAFVNRQKKVDVIIDALNKHFNSKTGAEILEQYDILKGGKN